MTPELADLKKRFDDALDVYMAAIKERKRLLDEAVKGTDLNVYTAHAQAVQTELQRREEYYEVGNRLQRLLTAR